MLLNEIAGPAAPVYACWIKEQGPKGVQGFMLYGLSPAKDELDLAVQSAERKGEDARLKNLETIAKQIKDQNLQVYMKPITWWGSLDDFNSGRPNVDGMTKRDLYVKHPNLKIFKTKEDAAHEMKVAGLI